MGILDADLSPAPELVEVQLRLGDRSAAVATLEDFDRLAVTKNQPWSLARAERCRAMVAPDDSFSSGFERAFELHAATPDTFESARTRLLFGGRLRRSGKRVRSRQEIRHALELFEQLGAEPWAEQASSELAATGETARRRSVETLFDLTPQEFQVAQLLAGGNTTREAASALFLSRKTIEYHLGHIYSKLGIHSRAELTAAMASQH
jgi:DNA-binding CsgD family transcriptional regulator